MLGEMNKRIDETNMGINEINTSLNKWMDGIEMDIRMLIQEVSSIKSDIISLLKEKIGWLLNLYRICHVYLYIYSNFSFFFYFNATIP